MKLDQAFLGKLAEYRRLIDRRSEASARGDTDAWARIDAEMQVAASALATWTVGYFSVELRDHMAADRVVAS